VEIHELLAVYQTTTLTCVGKERAYWGAIGLSLLSSSVLLAIGMLSLSATWLEGWRWIITGVAGLGVVTATTGALLQYRLGRELSLWQGFLRQLEQEFAGIEFHRDSFRFRLGQKIQVPSTSVRCCAWYPELRRIGPLGRLAGRLCGLLLPTAFLAAWVLLGLYPWLTW
jgi:hypothetical protein